MIKEVPLDFKQTYLNSAWEEVLDEVEDKDKYLKCNGVEYDENQIQVKRFDSFGVKSDNDDWETYTVFGHARLKYLDKDIEEKCHKNLDFEVFYEEDENPKVNVDF